MKKKVVCYENTIVDKYYMPFNEAEGNLFMILVHLYQTGDSYIRLDEDTYRKFKQFKPLETYSFSRIKALALSILSKPLQYRLKEDIYENGVLKGGEGDLVYQNIFSQVITGDGYVTIKLDDNIKSLFTDLKKFSQHTLEDYFSLNSKYSQKLFILLNRWKGYNKPLEMELGEFKLKLGLPESYKAANIKQRILNPKDKESAAWEVMDKTNIKFTSELKKVGRSYGKIKFKIEASTPQIKEVPPVKYRGVKPEEATEHLKGPITDEIKLHKAEILKLAKEQLPGPQFNIFKTTVNMLRTKEQINNLVMEFCINKTL